MRRIILAVVMLALATSGDAQIQPQPIDPVAYLNQIVSAMDNRDIRRRVSNSVFILNAMNEAFSSDIDVSPTARVRRFDQLNKLSMFIQRVPGEALRSSIGPATADFSKALQSYDKFAREMSILPNEALYQDGRAAIAVAAMATKTQGSPIFGSTLCDSFFIKWICSKFG